MLGCETTFHQPCSAIEPAGISEVRKSPSVGISHSSAMNASRSCSGSLAALRATLAARDSAGRGAVGAAAARGAGTVAASISALPLEAAHVEQQRRDDQQEQERRDRRAEAEVV